MLQVAHPGPRYGGRVPVRFCNISGAWKFEWRPALPPGPTGGLTEWRIFCIAIPLLRLDVQSQRASGPMGTSAPTKWQKHFAVEAAPCGRPPSVFLCLLCFMVL